MDFLINHFAQLMVLLVVAGTIFSKLRKAVKSQPPGTKPYGRMPDFGGGPGTGGRPVRQQDVHPPKSAGTDARGRAFPMEEQGNRSPAVTRREADERRMWTGEGESSGEGPYTPVPDPVPAGSRSPWSTAAPARGSDSGSGIAGEVRRSGLGSGIEAEAAADSGRKSGANWAVTNGNDVVQGLIWSEVIGPPRAKRPYRR